MLKTRGSRLRPGGRDLADRWSEIVCTQTNPHREIKLRDHRPARAIDRSTASRTPTVVVTWVVTGSRRFVADHRPNWNLLIAAQLKW